MPPPRTAGTGRTRGSWTPRIAGISAAVLVACGGAIAYLIAAPASAARHRDELPTRVVSVQIVGLVAQVPTPGGDNSPRMLTASSGGLQFGAMPAARLAQGNPQWTTDTMAGGTYVFIYAPSGQCLAAPGLHPALSLRRCNLRADQRWQRVPGAVPLDGHEYSEYRNLASGSCLSAGNPTPETAGTDSSVNAAVLAPCDRAEPPGQLVSFWWAA